MSNKYLEKIAEICKEAEAQHSDYIAPIAGAAVGGAATHALTKHKTEKEVHDKAFRQVSRTRDAIRRGMDYIDNGHLHDYSRAYAAFDDSAGSLRIPPNITRENSHAVIKGISNAREMNMARHQAHLDKAHQLPRALARKAGKGALLGLGIGSAVAYGLHKKDKPSD